MEMEILSEASNDDKEKEFKDELLRQLMFEIRSVFADENLYKIIEAAITIKQKEISKEKNGIKKKLLEDDLRKNVANFILHLKDKRHEAPSMFRNLLPVYEEDVITKLNLDNMKKNSDEIPSPLVEVKKDNGNKSEKLVENKNKQTTPLESFDLSAASEEVLKDLIDSESESLNTLISKLETRISASLDIKEKEEKTKEKRDLVKKIGSWKRLKNTAKKLEKIRRLKEEIERSINDVVAFEENKKDFDSLILATNKCLEDLKIKYNQYILDNKLGDFEKEQFNQIISEYENSVSEAISENDKKKLEEIGADIKLSLKSSIKMEDEEIDNADDDKKVESENFDRKSVMEDFNSFFDKLRSKIIDFEKIYSSEDDKDCCKKIVRNIEYWAKKINDFEKVGNPSNEDIKRIMQLHGEIKKWTEESWTELYRMGNFELAVRDYLKKEEMEKEYDFSRKSAGITFARVGKFEELNALDEVVGDDKFKEVTRKILEDLVVHGKLEKDEKTGEFKPVEKADLDGKTALSLLKLAGVDISKVEYVAPGEITEGKINIDTGNKEGLHILEDGTVIIDHHGPDSPSNTSATHKVYDILVSLGMLDIKKDDYLEDLVKFVDNVDNFDYPKSYYKDYFKKSWKTLFGLSKMLNWDELVEFFQYKDPKTGAKLKPEAPLSRGLLQKFKFVKKIKDKKTGEEKEIGKSISHKERVLASKEELEKMEKEGFIIDSARYGKICLNINGRIQCGIDAAKAFGCNTFLSWSTNGNGFAVSSLKGREIEDNFTDGLNIRKTMWVNPKNKERHVSLSEILNKMTDGKFLPSEEVKKFLEENNKMENVKDEDEINEDLENAGEALTDLSHEEIGHPAPETINEDIPIIDDFEFEDAMEFSEEEKVLSSEELKKVLSLERREKMGVNREALRKKFGNFILNHQGEEFCKVMLHRILDLDDKFAQINRKFKKMEEGDEMDENILNEINKLDGEIVNLSNSNWEEELKKFKLEKEEAEFNEKQKEKIKVVTELFEKKKFVESLEGSDWNGYREDDKKTAIELIVKAQLRLVLAKMKKDFDSESVIDKATDKIFDNLKLDKK